MLHYYSSSLPWIPWSRIVTSKALNVSFQKQWGHFLNRSSMCQTRGTWGVESNVRYLSENTGLMSAAMSMRNYTTTPLPTTLLSEEIKKFIKHKGNAVSPECKCLIHKPLLYTVVTVNIAESCQIITWIWVYYWSSHRLPSREITKNWVWNDLVYNQVLISYPNTHVIIGFLRSYLLSQITCQVFC